MDETKVCIYHDACYDGWTAAWIVKRFVAGWDDCLLWPATWGDEPPRVGDMDVLVVDFSYSRSQTQGMIHRAKSMRVLDHHKTAQEELEGLEGCLFDDKRSGAGLAWDELVKPSRSRPWLVDVIEDRDLWKHKIPQGSAAQSMLGTLEMTLEAWDKANEMSFKDAVRAGQWIERYIRATGEKLHETAKFEVLHGHRVPTMNIAHVNASEHLNGLLEKHADAPFVASYFRREDGLWQFSLRSRKGFDVSEIAKHYGGGGHAQAAGFTLTRLPW